MTILSIENNMELKQSWKDYIISRLRLRQDNEMARKNYRITTEFTYKDGTTKGTLDTTVNSKKAVEVQLKANQEWLDHKGHTVNSTVVTEAS